MNIDRPVGPAVTHPSRERDLRFKSQIGQIGHRVANGSPSLRHFLTVLPGSNEAEMGPANLLQASAKYRKYNERFDLI